MAKIKDLDRGVENREGRKEVEWRKRRCGDGRLGRGGGEKINKAQEEERK